jgi:hypothetical protein
MVFNASFNNISVLSWRSVLLVDETGENHRHVTDKLDHINVVHFALIYFSSSLYFRCGRDRMVVGFITTYAISAYHH